MVAHAANVCYRTILKESAVFWADLNDEERASIVQGVTDVINYPNEHYSWLHDRWCNAKRSQGWLPGVYNRENKTHPNLVPWEKLHPDQQSKDKLFKAIVLALK